MTRHCCCIIQFDCIDTTGYLFRVPAVRILNLKVRDINLSWQCFNFESLQNLLNYIIIFFMLHKLSPN